MDFNRNDWWMVLKFGINEYYSVWNIIQYNEYSCLDGFKEVFPFSNV
jgi:hypothetical protein